MKKIINFLTLYAVLALHFIPEALAMASRPNPDPNAPPPPGWVSWAPLAVMIFIFYFLLIRPQSKQRKERQNMLDNLKKGDKIITQGGIFATIVNAGADSFEVKINEEVKVKITKAAVGDVIVEKKQKELVQK